MFVQMMSADLPNEMHAELVRIGERERLARRVARERKAALDGGYYAFTDENDTRGHIDKILEGMRPG